MRALSSVLGGRLRGTTSAAALLGLALGVFLAAAPAEAEKVGVAAAVNPDAFSSLSGAPQSQLNIGKSIFYNERINTTGSGLVQVLLVDGSTFTVGPGSDLVIDRFVYNPKKQTGQVVATFSKGVVRYVGGKISKNDAGVTVKTPTGALAIRGGIVQGNGKVWSFLYGAEMVFTGKNGQTYTVYQPGYTLDLTSGTPKVRPTTAADIKSIMSGLTNGNTGGIGNAGDVGNPAAQQQLLAETISLQDLISDAAGDRMTDTIANEEPQTEEPETDTLPPPPPPPPPPPTAELRVLSTPDIDSVSEFQFIDGRIIGTAGGMILDLPANPSGCADGICYVEDARITQNGLEVDYEGIVIGKKDFVTFQLKPTEVNGDPVLVIGGTGHDFAPPDGRLHVFQLGKDILNLDGFGPFASADVSPGVSPDLVTLAQGGVGFVSPMMLLEKDSPNSEGGNVWLQASFAIDGEGRSQTTFIDIALGEWDPVTGVTGHRRGGSQLALANLQNQTQQLAPGQTTNDLTGEIASVHGPDGSHFLGSDTPNVVLGVTSPNSDQRETHHVGVGNPDGPFDGPAKNGGELSGFAAGLAQSGSGAPEIVASSSADDVTLNLNAETNTMTASLKVGEGLLQNPKYNLKFGGEGRSAYIDDNTFAAIEQENGSSVSEDYRVLTRRFPFFETRTHLAENPDMQGYIISADAIGANEALFPGETVLYDNDVAVQRRAFCQDCDFIKWGAWGTKIGYQDRNHPVVNQNVHLGWWIASDVVNKDDMPNTGSATYQGDAVGNVANRQNGVWNQYVATGDMTLTWEFAPRTGTLRIENFDNRNFTGHMRATSANPHIFSGPLAGSGTHGAASGAFVGRELDAAPRGVIGDFGVGNSNYKATGIFGGVR